MGAPSPNTNYKALFDSHKYNERLTQGAGPFQWNGVYFNSLTGSYQVPVQFQIVPGTILSSRRTIQSTPSYQKNRLVV